MWSTSNFYSSVVIKLACLYIVATIFSSSFAKLCNKYSKSFFYIHRFIFYDYKVFIFLCKVSKRLASDLWEELLSVLIVSTPLCFRFNIYIHMSLLNWAIFFIVSSFYETDSSRSLIKFYFDVRSNCKSFTLAYIN